MLKIVVQMKKFIFFLVLMLAGLLTNASKAQTLPPSDLLLWLMADAGVDTLNGTVSRWHDQSGNGNDVIQTNASRQPLLVANILNGKPVIRFGGESCS